MLTCKETAQLLSKSFETELSWWKKLNLKLHLSMCDLCNRYLRQLKMIRKIISSASEDIKVESWDDREALPLDVKQHMYKNIMSKLGT